MSTQFQYSLLQYHHLKREEWLTVGVLVLFAPLKKAVFLYPEKLGRVRCAFPDAPEKLLRGWLKGLAYQTEKLNIQPDIFARYDLEKDLGSLVSDFFLPSDNSSLQFGEFRSAVQYHEDPSVICQYLESKYLGVYQHEDDDDQKDNSWLASQFRKCLREQKPDIFSKKAVKENYVAHYNKRDYKFEFAWNNHTFNLVNAVSLDLKRPDSIQRKAEQYYGKFSLLHSFAEEKNVRFDVLLSRPTNRNLFHAYDKALEDISQAEKVNIIEFDKIRTYAEKTIDEIIFPKDIDV